MADRVRSLGVAALATAGVLILTQVVFPGVRDGRGTPGAILFGGLSQGVLVGLLAVGLVLVYRTTRIINFAQAALGAFGAVFTYNLIIVYNLPYGLALVTGVLVAAALGLAVELLILRRFFTAPRLVATIVTMAVAALVANMGVPIVSLLPIWGDGRGLAEAFGAANVNPVASIDFRIGDLAIPFGFIHVFGPALGLACVAGLGLFLRFTRVGTAIRASATNTHRAELLGINVRLLSTLVWTIAGALSGISVIVVATMEQFALAQRGSPEVLLVALAAAVVARMKSLPVAVYAAVIITVLQHAARWSYSDVVLVEALLVVVIGVGLLFHKRATLRSVEVTSWEASEEVRPTPPQLQAVAGIRTWRRALIGLGAIAVLVYPWTTTSGQVNRGSLAAIYAIVMLSLVVLTGWAGQVSFGQFALVAVGALVGGAITSRAELTFWLAVPAGVGATVVVALVVAIPALRIRGLFLGIVTFAFAASAALVLFDERLFGWLQPRGIDRPTLGPLNFQDERSMYYLSLVFLTLSIAVVLALRRGRPGRVLVALRNNEDDIQAFGVNVLRTKLMAFAVSGALCGLAGVLWAHHQLAVDRSAFAAQASIDVFLFAVIGGVASVTGALLGAGLLAAFQLFPISDPILATLLSPGFGVLAILYLAPGGVASIVYRLRDSVLRIVAQRRQLVVPSLFSDVDPAALEARLVPLVAVEDQPMDKGEVATPYELESTLYGQRDGLDSAEPEDRAVLESVASQMEDS